VISKVLYRYFLILALLLIVLLILCGSDSIISSFTAGACAGLMNLYLISLSINTLQQTNKKKLFRYLTTVFIFRFFDNGSSFFYINCCSKDAGAGFFCGFSKRFGLGTLRLAH